MHSEHSGQSLRSAPSVHSRHSSFSAHSQQVRAALGRRGERSACPQLCVDPGPPALQHLQVWLALL